MSKPGTYSNSPSTFGQLLWRYCSFVWLFDEVPTRANQLVRAATVRANRSRGMRFLPCYINRYLRWALTSTLLGATSQAMAAPVVVTGSCFTVASLCAIALLLAALGYAAMRWCAFDYSGLPR